MNIRRLTNEDFNGAKAFYTGFDDFTTKRKRDKSIVKKSIERDLKVLLLTKNTVVCGASQIVNREAFDILYSNPIILQEKLIIPALREDKNHVIDYIDDKKFSQSELLNMIAFYSDNISDVVSWKHLPNTTTFKTLLIKSLNDPNTVLRRNLRGVQSNLVIELSDKISLMPTVSREQVMDLIKNWALSNRNVTSNYINFLYNLSGANTVQSESALPLGNYIDYSGNDIVSKNTTLTDTEIFLKLFFELAFELVGKPKLNVDRIDNLTFENINEIRNNIFGSSFIQTYQNLIEHTAQIFSNQSGKSIEELRIGDFETLAKLSDKIREAFEYEFRRQAIEFTYSEQITAVNKNMHSFAFGVLDLFVNIANVPYNWITATFPLIQNFRSFIANLNHTVKHQRDFDKYYALNKYKAKQTQLYIDKYQIGEKKAFYDLIKLIQAVGAENENIGISRY